MLESMARYRTEGTGSDPAARGPLTRVIVGRTFDEARGGQVSDLRGADVRSDEDMIQFECHAPEVSLPRSGSA